MHNQYLPGLWKIRKTVSLIAWHFFIVQLKGSVYWLDLQRKASIYYLKWAISKDKMDIFTMIIGKVELVWKFCSFFFKYDLQKNIINFFFYPASWAGAKKQCMHKGLKIKLIKNFLHYSLQQPTLISRV